MSVPSQILTKAPASSPLPETSHGAVRPAERILDLGCGGAAALNDDIERLRASHAQTGMPAAQGVGVDISMKALRQAKQDYPNCLFVCARGERLPFRDQSFRMVESRVALPYMDIPVTLSEVRRVLSPDGEVRMKLHPFSFTRAELRHDLSRGPLLLRLKNLIYRAYVMANGLALHLFGINFGFPVFHKACESFQTENGMKRLLANKGFCRIEIPAWSTKIDWPHAGNCRAKAVRSEQEFSHSGGDQ